jgi:hypothetical protein
LNSFRSLPNWTDLQAQKTVQQQLGRCTSTEEESPEDVRQRNLREAEILAGNLGEGAINAHEILSDVSQLRGLAQLQESAVSTISVAGRNVHFYYQTPSVLYLFIYFFAPPL